MKGFGIALAAMLICPVVGCLAIEVSLQVHQRQPSDAQAIAHFRAHRSTFETLAKMAWEDRGRIDALRPKNDRDLGPDPVAPARLREYRRLLEKAEVWEMRVWDKKRIDFIYHVGGVPLTSTDMKGFLYAPKAPPDLDLLPDLGGDRENRQGARYINGNWYLYYREVHG